MAGSLQEKTGAAAKHMQKHIADCIALQSHLIFCSYYKIKKGEY